MQVIFAPPPAVVPGGQPSTEFASGQSDTEGSSFASLLDSNSNAPGGAPSPVEPPARQPSAPFAPDDAAAGESVADDQEVGAAPEDPPSIDEWLATAVDAAISFQVAPLPVSQDSTPWPAEVAVDAGAALSNDGMPGITPSGEDGPLPEGAAPAAVPTASAPAVETAVTAAAPRPQERHVAPQAAPDRAPANDVVGDADAEVVPVSSSADGDEAPAPLIPGHSDARRDEANPAVAGAIARQVPAAPHAQVPAAPVLPAHAAPQRQVTAGSASADSDKAGADVGGAAAPLPSYPNARIVVPAANAPAQATPPTPAPGAKDPAAAASPVGATPTLTQVLVEGSRGRQSRDAAAPQANPEAEVGTRDTAAADSEVVPQPVDDSSTEVLPLAHADTEVVPVSSSADGDEAPAPLIPGHSDARRDEANPAVAGAIARQVPAAPHAQVPAAPLLPAHAAPQRQATAGSASADSDKASADVGGAAAPLPSYPNARIVVPVADAPAQVTSPTPSPDAQDPAAVASPVVAAPTLTQVLVEGSRGRQSRDAAAPQANPEAEVGTSDTAAADSEVVPQPADDSSTEVLPLAREGKKAAVSQRTSRENLAVTSGRMVKVTSGRAAGTWQRKFLNVDGERVGDGGALVGTDAAKESQPMTAPTQVLPTVAPSSLAASEGMPAAANAAWHASPVAASHAAAPSAVHAAAVEAVHEAVEAAERAQQTGRNQVELRLPTSNDESLRVHLRLQDGVIHAKFVAPTTELQQALSKEWSLLAPRLAERGVKFGETSFENRDQSGQPDAQNAFASGQQRQPQHDRNEPDERAQQRAFSLSSPAVSTPVAARRSSTAAPVLATASATPTTAEARGLHAWA